MCLTQEVDAVLQALLKAWDKAVDIKVTSVLSPTHCLMMFSSLLSHTPLMMFSSHLPGLRQ